MMKCCPCVSPSDTTPLPYGTVAIIVLITAVLETNNIMVFSYLPKMLKSFGTPEVDVGYQVGLLGAAMSISWVLSFFIWGYIGDRYGRKRALLFTMCGAMMTGLSFGFSTSFYWALCCRFLFGLFMGITCLLKSILMFACDHTNRTLAFSIYYSVWTLALLYGPSVSGFLVFPVEQYPKVFKNSSLFQRFKVLLPNLIVAFLWICMIAFAYLFLNDGTVRKDGKIEVMVNKSTENVDIEEQDTVTEDDNESDNIGGSDPLPKAGIKWKSLKELVGRSTENFDIEEQDIVTEDDDESDHIGGSDPLPKSGIKWKSLKEVVGRSSENFDIEEQDIVTEDDDESDHIGGSDPLPKSGIKWKSLKEQVGRSTENFDIEEEDIVMEDDDETNNIGGSDPLPKSRIKWKSLKDVLLSKDFICCTILSSAVDSIGAFLEDMFPVFALTLQEYNGLALNLKQVGIVYLGAAGILLPCQYLILPKILKYMGSRGALCFASLMLALGVPLIPLIAGHGVTMTIGTSIFAMGFGFVLLNTNFIAIQVLINNCTPPNILGIVYSIAGTSDLIGRTVGPLIYGPLYSWSLKNVKGVNGNEKALGFPFDQYFVFLFLAMSSLAVAIVAKLVLSKDLDNDRRQ